ncbi:thiamine phosphate synthase [Rhizorhabdus sp. FW153]|uniref:thiamine phosphate synthase n=1 Tax=Rhizorhabdus sp. FW153 TaxID=3400216 RepID=UPI003CF59CB5
MTPRQPVLPHLWLMTDERLGERLFDAIDRLPRGSGVIFRHYSLPVAERRRLFDAVRRRTRRRGLVLLLAGDEHMALRWGADGAHHRQPHAPRFGTSPVHDRREIRAAERSGATALLLSPLYATRSHPGASGLGRMRFAALLRATRLPVIALGGMTARRGRHARLLGAQGWAAIDAWGGRASGRKQA